jgi:hypothetical protein
MGMEFNIGLMALIMKVIGAITKPKAKEPSGTLKVMCTEVISEMTWLMAMENIHILTDLSIKVNLEMTFKKDTEKKNG